MNNLYESGITKQCRIAIDSEAKLAPDPSPFAGVSPVFINRERTVAVCMPSERTTI
jgi:hypothetical protein